MSDLASLTGLDAALAAMDEAVRLTQEKGPAVGMEFIADFMNNRDAVDEELAATLADDWLTRWKVEKVGFTKGENDGA